MNTLTIDDSFNNKLVIEKQPPFQVFIQQANENRNRMVGYLEPDENGMFTYKKHEKEEDIYRKTKAWSIHSRILDFAQNIEYITNTAVYTISTQDARIKSGKMIYKNASYTEKIYVPIKEWKIEFKDSYNQALYNRLGYEWWSEIKYIFKTDRMKEIGSWLLKRRQTHTVYPPKEEVFNAFKSCDISKTKVVIVGQDPYHNGSAHGLAFSIKQGSTPVSLRNILKEVQDDYYANNFAFKSAHSTNLSRWCNQGVLLLNKTLTVDKGHANSHKKYWEGFIQLVINTLIDFKEARKQPLVFILWGKEAQSVLPEKYNEEYIHVIKSAHPAAEAYSGGNSGFFGSKPFTKCNKFLNDRGEYPISW